MSDLALTLKERLERRAAMALPLLPPEVQVRLSGMPPLRVDGLTLEPELQLLLTTRLRLGARRFMDLAPVDARRRARREALVHAGPVDDVEVRTRVVPGAEGLLAARHYVPERGDGAPLLVFFHGGGFVVGDLDTHDAACRLLCSRAGVHVLAVDYRLAPEWPFPAAVEDARAVFAWAAQHAAGLGADPERVAIGGDSAGGNLAAVTSQEAVRARAPAPVLQLLIYPPVDRTITYPSLVMFDQPLFLVTRDEMAWFHTTYLGPSRVHSADPRVSPLCSPDLSGLPPALVYTAGFDPLRDEGEAYAAALRAAGGDVALRRFGSLPHGFANLAGVSPACRGALQAIAHELGQKLGSLP
jgi:acetyl esterase